MSEQWFEEWVEKAEEDFRAASALEPESVPSVICFLCQQCVEKYLKAALVRHEMPTQKTHNLILLNAMVSEKDKRFAELEDQLALLNPYSVLSRYPGMDTTASTAKKAFEVARALRKQIRELLNLEAKE